MADNMAQCSVDLKKNRIRVHKDTLRQMGNPRHVQLLVNEEKQLLAINSTSTPFCGSVHKVTTTSPDLCVEIYSEALIHKLSESFPQLSIGSSYRLSGWIHPSDGVAVFSVASAQKIEQEV